MGPGGQREQGCPDLVLAKGVQESVGVGYARSHLLLAWKGTYRILQLSEEEDTKRKGALFCVEVTPVREERQRKKDR